MSKIKPTSTLPYIKQTIAPDPSKNADNTSKALSDKIDQEVKEIKNLLGAINAAAAYNSYITNSSEGHLGTTISAWRSRKS